MSGVETSQGENFGRLFVRHQSQIYGYIRSLGIDRHDAEEVLQETAAVLWTKFEHFEPGTNFLAWALAVAHREARKHVRQKNRSALVLSESIAELLAAETVEQQSELLSVRDALAACLRRLGKRERDLIRNRYEREGTIRGLAEQLGRPASSIYNALARIHGKLLDCVRRQLAAEGRS